MKEEKFDLSESLAEARRKVITFDKGSLKRVLGVGALYSIGYGDVGSSIFYALGVTTLWALGASPLAIAIAGVFFVFTVLTYAELSASLPTAGGSSAFARKAFGDLASFIAGWALLLDYVVTISISAYTVPPYLSYFFPFLKMPFFHLTFSALLIGALTYLNVMGIKESTGLSIGLCVVSNITQLGIIVVGAVLLLDFPRLVSQIHWGVSPTWHNFIYGVSIAMVAYTGIEAVSQLSGEARDPGRKVPRAMLATMFTVLLTYIGVSIIALSAMSPGELSTKWLDNPLAGIAKNMPRFGSLLEPWIAILAAAILTIATNAGIIGASRLSYSMGSHFQIPSVFATIHRTRKTPYVSLIVFSVAATVIIVVAKNLQHLADLYNFGAMLAFSMAHLSLIGLRFREPDLNRPFRLKWNVRIAGREIPITALLGLAATLTVWFIVVFTHPVGRALGFAWMGIGVLSYLAYRRKEKMPFVEAVRIEKLEGPEFKGERVKKILVPTLGLASSELVQAACKLARQDGAEVVALNVIEIPATLPLDTFLFDKFDAGEKALDRARATGTEFGVHVETKLIQARSAGESIIDMARESKPDLIIIGASVKRTTSDLLGGTTADYVRKNAPCKVWILVQPQAGTRAGVP